MKQSKKSRKKLEGRINAWMVSPKMQKDVAAVRKPGSRKV